MIKPKHIVATAHAVFVVVLTTISLPHVQTHVLLHQNAHCSGDHPASYKGCSVYKDLQQSKKPITNSNFLSNNIRNRSTTVRDSHPLTNTTINQLSNHAPTYAQAISDIFNNSDLNSSPDFNDFNVTLTYIIFTYNV